MYALLAVFSIIVVTSVYAMLCMPAISMARSQPVLEAERVSAVFGDTLSFRVTAEAPEGKEQSVFALHTMSNGGGLSDEYEFDAQDVAVIETEDGSSLELHRERDAEGETNYWFALDPGKATAFLLNCDNDSWVAPDGEAVEQPEESPEAEVPGNGGGAELPAVPEEGDTQEPTEPSGQPVLPESPEPSNPDEGKNTETEEPGNSGPGEAEEGQQPEISEPETETPPPSEPTDGEQPNSSDEQQANSESAPAAPDAKAEAASEGLLASIFLPAYALDEGNANEVLGGEPSDAGSGEAEPPSHEETPATPPAKEEPSGGAESPSDGTASEPDETPDAGAGETPDAGGNVDGSEPQPTETPDASNPGGNNPDETIPEQPSQLPEPVPPVDENIAEVPDDSFLAEDGENQFLTISGGFGDSYKSALSAAEWNDAAVELTWKEELEERTLTVTTESGVEITMTGLEDVFPGGADQLTLEAKELVQPDTATAETEEDPVTAALRAVEQAALEDGFAAEEQRLFEIRLVRDGEVVEPLGQVSVSFAGLMETETQMDAQVYHVADTDGAATATEMESQVRQDSGTVVMDTDHFSVYSVALAPVDTTKLDLDTIMTGLGDANQFAVFANNMTIQTDMEGNIAVRSLTFNGGAFGNSGNVYLHAAPFTLKIQKIVEGDSKGDQKYKFGIYTDEQMQNGVPNGNPFKTVTVTGSNSTEVTDLTFEINKKYYVFELDAGNKPLLEGKGDGFEVSYEGNELISSSNDDNYVEDIANFTNLGDAINIYSGMVYVGDSFTAKDKTITKNGKTVKLDSGAEGAGTPTGRHWDTDFTRLKALSVRMAEASTNYKVTLRDNALYYTDTTPGVKVLNLTAPTDGNITAQVLGQALGSDQNLGNALLGARGFPLKDDQYLVVNVDCSKVTGETITLPTAMGVNGSGGDNWSPDSTRLLWNFVKNDQSYTGTVQCTNESAGTMFAPAGTVKTGTTHNGAIIANIAIQGNGEIHKHSFLFPNTAVVKVTNTYPQKKGLELVINKQNTEGQALDGVTFELYTANEEWEKVAIVGTQTTTGGGKAAFPDLAEGNYLLVETEAADGYMKPAKPWYVTVTGDNIILSNEEIQQTPDEGGAGQEERSEAAPEQSGEIAQTTETPETTSFPFTITNQKLGGKLSVTVNKKWEGDGGANPDSVTVYLLANGVELGDGVVLNAKNGWTHTWSKLEPADEDGTQIVYSVREDEVPGYYATITRDEAETNQGGWEKAETLTSDKQYLLVAGDSTALVSNGTALKGVDVSENLAKGTMPAGGDAALWAVTVSGSWYRLTNVGARANLRLTYLNSDTNTTVVALRGNEYTSWFGYSESKLWAYYYNYYLYGTPTGNGYQSGYLNITNRQYATDYTFYEWQGTPVSGQSFTITNTKEPTAPDKKQELEINKTIDALRGGTGDKNPDTTLDDGDENMTDLYRLYLDLKAGMIGAPADVVLVIDNSNSMQTSDMNGTRAAAAVNTAEDFAKQILGSDSRNRVSVVGYSGTFNGYTQESGSDSNYDDGSKDAWTKSGWQKDYDTLAEVDLTPLKNDILINNGSNSSGSGTNIMQALHVASELLKESETNNAGANRYMIFLSDGYPTYYYLTLSMPDVNYDYSYRQYAYTVKNYYGQPYSVYFNPSNYDAQKTFGEGYLGRFGTGTDSSGKFAKQPTIDYAKDFRHKHDDTTIYSLGVGQEGDTENPLMLDTLKEIASSEENYKSVSDSASLQNAFDSILYGKPVSNVSVSDDLSQYVEWYGTQPDVLVTMEKEDGTVVKLWQGTGAAAKGTIGAPLADNTTTQDRKSIQIIKDVTYTPTSDDDSTTGTVTVTFNPEYRIVPENTYTLSFNVKTTETAHKEYEDNLNEEFDGYKDVKGDPGTDYKTNTTSSEKPGFHSNSKAQVDYIRGGQTCFQNYDHPVVQVNSKSEETLKTVSVTVNKIWAGDAGKETERPDELIFDLYKNGESTGESITLTAKDNWRGSFGMYPAIENGQTVTYTVVERLSGEEYELQETRYDETTWNPDSGTELDPNMFELWVPVDKMEAGEDYLVVDGTNQPGERDLLRAKACQTEEILKAAATIAETPVKDTEGNTYKNYILMYNSDGSSYGLSWEARAAGYGYTLASNVIPMWDGGCYGYLQSGENGHWKVLLNEPPSDKTPNVTFLPDGKGGFITDNGSTVYLYKKVALDSVPPAYSHTDLSVTVINRYTGEGTPPDSTSLCITKEWEGGDIAARPDSVTMQILANGKPTGQQVTLTADGGWKARVDGLDRLDKDGKPIEYSVSELGSGFVAKVGDTEITNEAYWVMVDKFEDGGTYILTTTTGTGNVYADEASSRGSTHSWNRSTIKVTNESVTLGGQTFDQYISDAEAQEHTRMQWVASDIEKKTGTCVGKRHCFTLENGNKYFSTATSKNGTLSLKSWSNDSSTWIYYGLTARDLDNKPINAYYTPTRNDDSEWSYLIGGINNNCLLNKNGSNTAGAASTSECQTFYLYKRVELSLQNVTVTNTPAGTIDIPVTKVWVDKDGDPMTKSLPDSVIIQLYANGAATEQKLRLTAEDHWNGTFTGLPAADTSGNAIVYSINESPVPGFKAEIAGSAGDGFQVTNKEDHGYDLPKTGGTGTGLFAGLGLLLMAGAAITLILIRRRERGAN